MPQLAPLNKNVDPPVANFAALALLLGALGLVHLHGEAKVGVRIHKS